MRKNAKEKNLAVPARFSFLFQFGFFGFGGAPRGLRYGPGPEDMRRPFSAPPTKKSTTMPTINKIVTTKDSFRPEIVPSRRNALPRGLWGFGDVEKNDSCFL